MSKQYLTFVEVPNPGKKTKRFTIHNREASILGEIHYRNTWRRYIFYPYPSTVFDASCLAEVSKKLEELAAERNRKI